MEKSENTTPAPNNDVRPDVLNFDDIKEMVPKLAGHEKLVNNLLHWLQVDEVNAVHGRWCDTPGPEFVKRMMELDFKIKLRVDNEQVLDHLPEGAFITVSNHPFGALDGITLIYLIGSRRPKFKVMVNMILNKISAMHPNFIAVNAWASDDPEKKKVSVSGLFEAMRQLRDGNPIGFFPAGAMSKVNWRLRLQDRPWQESVLKIIYRAKVPVIPIFFHGTNSWWFNFLGVVCWQARSFRLPAEVFRKRGKTLHVSIGDPISVEDQARFDSPEALGAYLRAKTYALRDIK
ncbi:MAG: lysophospholipid acyltransferase family protein [Bacteroidales bacterium]|nr:lysophospholipid acyltransferase family protein [Bacteroidales bacterium]